MQNHQKQTVEVVTVAFSPTVELVKIVNQVWQTNQPTNQPTNQENQKPSRKDFTEGEVDSLKRQQVMKR